MMVRSCEKPDSQQYDKTEKKECKQPKRKIRLPVKGIRTCTYAPNLGTSRVRAQAGLTGEERQTIRLKRRNQAMQTNMRTENREQSSLNRKQAIDTKRKNAKVRSRARTRSSHRMPLSQLSDRL